MQQERILERCAEESGEVLAGLSKYHAGREAVFAEIWGAKEAVWQGFYKPGVQQIL